MEKFYDGTGFSPKDARQNAEAQIADFIESEKQMGKNLCNVNTDIQNTSQNGNLYYCTLKIKYDEN